MIAILVSLLLTAGSSVVAVTVVAASVVLTAAPAKAAGGPPLLVVLVNNEATAPEAALLTSAGYTVTQVTPAALASMSQSTFQGYAAVVIGDPSSGGTCSSWQPTTDTLGTNWEGWVTGNVAVLGTAPELAAALAAPGNTAAATLITGTARYAAAQPGSTVTQTGLYLSLDCGYSTAAKGTAVPLLSGVEGIGAAGGVTVNGSLACADSGAVNKWESAAAGTFGGFTSASLAAGAPGWPSPGCPVQEAFDSWPAMFTPVAYDAAGDATANFTASNGTAGQPYILLGAPVSAATQALAPSTNGEVPVGTTVGGSGNAAAGGVSQALTAGSVNTENGDLTQSNADVSIPTFGPPLSFSRTYDSSVAQQQTQTGSPGPMGFGWTDDWASSLTQARPVAGDIYTLAGTRAAAGPGGPPASAVLGAPQGVAYNGGNTYLADSAGNRILEVPGTSGTQWGISMTAGDAYVVVGAGIPDQWASLNHPQGIAFDSAGDMYIADTWDSRILEMPVTSKTQWGISMTFGFIYTVAGSDVGTSGSSGDGGLATAALLHAPGSIAFDSAGNLYIADGQNNRLQEVAAATGTQWGSISMTANHVYTIAGSATGTAGSSGDGAAAKSALLSNPTAVTADSSGNVVIADAGNNRVQEIAKATGTLWGHSVTANDIYTIAGSATGTGGSSGDGGAASAALLNGPQAVLWASPNLYIADAYNNRVQEIAGSAGTQWGQSMTANDVYTIAGSAAGTSGFSGDGGAATAALLNGPLALTRDGSGNLYIADATNNRIREVSTSTANISTYAGGYTAATAGDGGPATQSGLSSPMQEAFDNRGDTYIADAGNNRIQEIAAYSHTQYGIAMTGGDVYTIAGHANGQAGCQCDGNLATQAYLNDPWGIVIDSTGNLYIADSGNNRIQEVPAVTGTQWGQSMTAGYMYTIAGDQHGAGGSTGDGGPASAALLNNPNALTMDPAGDIYISDSWNSRVQEIAAASGTQWGQSMTAGDIYTIAGQVGGAHGSAGDGGPGTSAYLYGAGGLALDSAGDLYIGDGGNNRVQELAAASHAQWGQSMTAGDIYTVTGGSSATQYTDGGPASATHIAGAQSLAIDADGDLYIADVQNNRIQEIANVTGTQWGQSMTAGDEYTVAGSPTSASGNSGDGGPATSALLGNTQSISIDPERDLYITDNANATVREVASAMANAIAPAPGQASALVIAPGNTAPSGLTVTQPGGAQVTFWAQQSGACATGYVAAGSYCILPQDQGATLSYNSGTQVYTFSPAPGSLSYTYHLSGASGSLTSETDPAGNTLTITASSPAPGGTVAGNGTCPATAGSCQTITSASGRALILGYSGPADTGQVTSATNPMNRTWTYGYTGSELTSATDPMGHKTTYTYGAGSTGNPLLAGDLLTITDPNAQPGGPDAGHWTAIAYDNAGQVTSQTDPMGWVTSLGYCVNAAAGDCMNSSTGTGLVTVTDPDGNQTVYDYAQGTLAAQSEWTKTPASLTLSSETDTVPDTIAASTSNPSGGTLLETSSTDGDGNQTSYAYDSAGDLTSSTGAAGDTTTTTYSSPRENNCNSDAEASAACSSNTPPTAVAPGGAITAPASAPPKGVTYTLHDTDGNILYTDTGVYEPGSSTAAYQQVTYTLYKGNSVSVGGTAVSCTATPPSQALPCAKISADGVVTQLTYDSAGDLIKSAAPDGNSGESATTSWSFDADGEQTSQTLPDGNLSGANAGNYTTVTAYNADGEKTSVSVGAGSGATVTARTTTYGYDADGNQVSVQDPRGFVTTTAYTADDKAALVTDPDGHATLTCYDGAGNSAQTVPPTGVAANGLTAASCPASYPAGYSDRLASDATTATYDAAGAKTAQTAPAPAGQSGTEATTYTYDSAGRTTKVVAPPASSASGAPGNVTTETYTPDGAIATRTTGYGTSTAATIVYCYDIEGNKTAMVPGDGNTSATTACSSSSPFATTYAYDSVGEKVSQVTPGTSADSAGGTTTWTYDPAGNPLTTTDPAGVTTTYTYTPAGKEATVSYSGSAAHSITLGYDADGSKVSMADATGTTTYTYDPFGELTSTTNGHGQTTGYSHDADGNTTGITYPLPSSATWAATATAGYAYDNAGNLTAVTDFAGHAIGVTSNADGLATARTLGATGDTITTGYDNANRTSSISLANSSGTTLQSFAYSDAPDGSILTETDSPTSAGTSKTYAYTAQDQLSSEVSSQTAGYAYDASGSLTGLPGNATGSYDNAGELTSSTKPGTATSYTYNADGQRTLATTGGATTGAAGWNGAGELASYTDSADAMTAASYDGNDLRAATTDSAGTQYYTWDTAASTPELLMDGSNAYIYGAGGSPAEQVNLSSGTASYLMTDALGSVRGTVSASGALTGSATYDAYGNPLAPGGLTAATPFGYAGYYTDGTGLDYLVNRYYDPATGQFLSVDPLASTTNAPYAYAAGNPATYTDPSGTSAVNCNWWGGFGLSRWGINIRIPAGQICSTIHGSGHYVNWVEADFEAAYVISAFSYQYRFAYDKSKVVYYELWSDHYGASSITNRDTYWVFNRYMHDGPFWTTFWVDWRAHSTATTTSNIQN